MRTVFVKFVHNDLDLNIIEDDFSYDLIRTGKVIDST
jgi:hypothetical protein